MKRTNLFLGLALTIMMMSCGEKKPSENKISQNRKEIRVKTIVVQNPMANYDLNYSGIIVPTLTIPLSFQLPGSVNEIFIDEGDFVKKGEILAEQDKTSYESVLLAAQAMQYQAQDAYGRLKTVYEKGSLPEIQWEDIKSKLEQANSATQIAKKNLDNCSIIAPSDGVIGTRNAEVGSTVIPGNTIFKLVIVEDVFVRVSVPENEINKIKKGQFATIQIPAIGNENYIGKVEKIGVMANLISKTYEIKIRVANKNLELKPGMVCNVIVSIQSVDNYITVPYRSVIKNGDGFNYIYIVNKQINTVKKQIIKVGKLTNNMIQVISGVSVGDILVVEGQHKLLNNDRVII